MEFRIEEQDNILQLYPLTDNTWMVVRSYSNAVWMLYKYIDKDNYQYIEDYPTLKDAVCAGVRLKDGN